MPEDWIQDLFQSVKREAVNIKKAHKRGKFCNWVENATASKTCASIVMQEGTIYCPYHTGLWLDMSREAEKHDMMRQLDGLPSRLTKRKPREED